MIEQATPETDADNNTQFELAAWELLKEARRERDEAQNLADKLARQGLDMMDENRFLTRERDEAREKIIGWENKWKCAVEMAARAEVERDELRDFADELVDLVAYGLGQNGSFWSQVAMKKAREAITKAKALEVRP